MHSNFFCTDLDLLSVWDKLLIVYALKATNPTQSSIKLSLSRYLFLMLKSKLAGDVHKWTLKNKSTQTSGAYCCFHSGHFWHLKVETNQASKMSVSCLYPAARMVPTDFDSLFYFTFSFIYILVIWLMLLQQHIPRSEPLIAAAVSSVRVTLSALWQ